MRFINVLLTYLLTNAIYFPKCCNRSTNTLCDFRCKTCEEPSVEHHGPEESVAALSLLCTETDVLRQLDRTEMIDDFAKLKCRTRNL